MRWPRLILLLFLASAAPPVLAGSIPAYTATYEAQAFGNTLVAQSTLSYEGDTIRMAMDAHVSGFLRILGRFEFNREAIFKSGDGNLNLVQTRSVQVTPRRERKVETRFDWTTNRAHGHINQKSFDLAVTPDTQDFLSSLYLTMQALRNDQLGDNMTVKVLERDRLREYSLTLLGVQSIDTVLGRLEALHVVRRDDSSGVELAGWFVPSLDYLPVRLDYQADGNVFQLELTKLEWHRPVIDLEAGRP
nr:DUF3108 domain-containing protein [Thioalkalivibrio sp.]